MCVCKTAKMLVTGFDDVTSPSKGQIDRLGERLKEGPVSEDDLRELDAYRESFTEAYNAVVTKIRSATGLEPTGRPRKTPFSILQKLRREKSMQLSRMQDIAGCRLVVAGVPEQDRLVGDLVHAFEKSTVVTGEKGRATATGQCMSLQGSRTKPLRFRCGRNSKTYGRNCRR